MKEKLKPVLKRLGIYMVTIGTIRLTVAAAGLIAEMLKKEDWNKEQTMWPASFFFIFLTIRGINRNAFKPSSFIKFCAYFFLQQQMLNEQHLKNCQFRQPDWRNWQYCHISFLFSDFYTPMLRGALCAA